MSEQQKRKGDFTPKYYNNAEIECDKTLLPAEQVRERVKHYAMCLFGLATDMASAEQAIIDKRLYVQSLENENAALRAKVYKLKTTYQADDSELVKELRAELSKERAKTPKRIYKLTTSERQAIQADYYEKRIRNLQATLNYYKKRCLQFEKELAQKLRGNDNGK